MVWHPILILYWENFFRFHHMYGQLLLMNFDEMKSLHLYIFHPLFNHWYYHLTLYLLLFKITECIKWTVILTLISERFDFPISLSLFDLFKLFYLLLLMCELTWVHHLFLEVYETFLTCFLLDDVNPITIYFNFVKLCLSTIELYLKIEKTFNVMSIECQLIIW